MLRSAKTWMLISAIGQGVLLSLALTGLVRISCWLSGTTLSDQMAHSLFFASSMVTGAVAVLIYARKLKQQEDAEESSPISANPR